MPAQTAVEARAMRWPPALADVEPQGCADSRPDRQDEWHRREGVCRDVVNAGLVQAKSRGVFACITASPLTASPGALTIA
jgi:hypothetical protein